jgi:uncharacterized protein YheU (UPF0270 family)
VYGDGSPDINLAKARRVSPEQAAPGCEYSTIPSSADIAYPLTRLIQAGIQPRVRTRGGESELSLIVKFHQVRHHLENGELISVFYSFTSTSIHVLWQVLRVTFTYQGGVGERTTSLTRDRTVASRAENTMGFWVVEDCHQGDGDSECLSLADVFRTST